MKLLRTALCLLALCLASRTASAAGWTVGTHRASGSYTCLVGNNSTTSHVSTYLYLAQTTVPGRWWLYLSADFNTVGVTLDIRDTALLEARGNGAVVYSVPQDTIYVHRVAPFLPIDYTHDEHLSPFNFQVTPVSTAHPYGQVIIVMEPQGASDVSKGECPSVVTMTLDIQP